MSWPLVIGYARQFRSFAQRRGHFRRVESLDEQIAPDAVRRGGVGNRAPPQALLERLLQQLRLVELGEDLGNRLARDAPVDAERLDLPLHAQAAALLDPHLGARAGESGAAVVERALAREPRDRGVDVVVLVTAPRQAAAYLRLRQLPPGEHRQAGDVRAAVLVGHSVSV